MNGLDWETLSAEFARRRELPLRGLRAICELRETLDRLERQFATEARLGGSTWADIGASLGISRQAAWVRHRPFVNATDGDSPRPFV